MEEMPPTTTKVQLLDKNNNIIDGQLVVEMSGWYVALKTTWGSLEDYTHWRFNPNLDYGWLKQHIKFVEEHGKDRNKNN